MHVAAEDESGPPPHAGFASGSTVAFRFKGAGEAFPSPFVFGDAPAPSGNEPFGSIESFAMSAKTPAPGVKNYSPIL